MSIGVQYRGNCCSHIFIRRHGNYLVHKKHRWEPAQIANGDLENKLLLWQKHCRCDIGNLPSQWSPSCRDGSQRCFEHVYVEPCGLPIMYGNAAAKATICALGNPLPLTNNKKCVILDATPNSTCLIPKIAIYIINLRQRDAHGINSMRPQGSLGSLVALQSG